MFGIQDVMMRRRGLVGISTELVVLTAYGLISFLIALRFFKYGKELSSP